MENKHIDKIKNIHIWCIEMLIGILTLSIVTVIAVDSDMSSTQKSLSYTAKYINERCNSFTRLNLASETKSLMRMIESAQQINRNIMAAVIYIVRNSLKEIRRNVMLRQSSFLIKRGNLAHSIIQMDLGLNILMSILTAVL